MRFYYVPNKFKSKRDAISICAENQASLLKITSEFEFKVAISLVLERSIQKGKGKWMRLFWISSGKNTVKSKGLLKNFKIFFRWPTTEKKHFEQFLIADILL